MTVLLPTDTVELYEPGPEDGHGFATPPPGTKRGEGWRYDRLEGGRSYGAPGSTGSPLWSGPASLQLGPGLSGNNPSLDGGRGPYDPAAGKAGTVYLPAAAPARDGLVLEARGRSYTLSATRTVADPVGLELGCVVAQLSEVRDLG